MNETAGKTVGYASQRLTCVAQNLYRNENDVYYVKMKKDGKQYKQSLDNHDRKTADRKLADFEKKVEREANEKPDVLFEDLSKRWLATIKHGLKEVSYRRRESCVNQLLPFFIGPVLAGMKARGLLCQGHGRKESTGQEIEKPEQAGDFQR
jgi:hypothetical protein